MRKRETDPLEVIPTTKAIKRWLSAAKERVRRLQILLSTAREIESQKIPDNPDENGSCKREDVSLV